MNNDESRSHVNALGYGQIKSPFDPDLTPVNSDSEPEHRMLSDPNAILDVLSLSRADVVAKSLVTRSPRVRYATMRIPYGPDFP